MVTLTSKPFYPPYIKPPPKPLSTFHYFKTVLSNALLSIPEPVYDEPIYSTRSFPPIVYVTDPSLVKEVLVDRQEEFEKEPVARRLLKPLIGDGILMAEGQSWRQQRRMAAPLFRHGEILRYIPSMARAADSLINQWRSLAPGSLLKIDEEMIKVTYDVISHTILAGGGSGVGEAVIQGRNDYQEGVNWWFVYSLLKLPHSLPRPKGRPMRAQEKRLRSAVADLIVDRRKATDDRDDILTRLLNVKDPINGQAMSDEQIVDNLLTFLLAGFDTTAMALTWALYLLSKAPEWENRVQEEIFRVVPEGPVTSKHIDKLTVVQQVIKEAMRLYPSAPVLLRRAVNGCELGGKKIEAGVTINIPIYAIHRHRNLWKDPNRFDPSRFTFGSEANYSRYQFMPFGGGPRICIGASFAHIEAVVILTTLVRSTRFECPPDVEPQPLGRIILVPKGGMPLHVNMRA